MTNEERQERRGHSPPPGHHHDPPTDDTDQPLHPGRRPQGPMRTPRQGGGGAGFVNVNNRLFAPLQGLDPNNVLQGGYGWLSMTDAGMTYHPGLDLNSGGSCNADEGLLVVAPLAGIVRATFLWDGWTAGEGTHCWVEMDDPCMPGRTWWHTDHLREIYVGVGHRLVPGEPIGTCGRSGGWDCAHAHTELLPAPPKQGWWQWPYGWSRGQVEQAYYDPRAWWNGATALVLAEGQQPIPPEVVMAMTDWQLTNWVLATLYEWAGVPFNPNSGLSKCWVAALRAGVYPGRPRTEERPFGEPNEGVWAEFDYRVLIYKNDGEMSWNG